MGKALQFMGDGSVREIGDLRGVATSLEPSATSPLANRPAAPTQDTVVASSPATVSQFARAVVPIATSKPEPVNPRAILKAARQRVKEIRAELKNKSALERELAQLTRMLKASHKSSASTVTPINSRRAG